MLPLLLTVCIWRTSVALNLQVPLLGMPCTRYCASAPRLVLLMNGAKSPLPAAMTLQKALDTHTWLQVSVLALRAVATSLALVQSRCRNSSKARAAAAEGGFSSVSEYAGYGIIN
jgi:hypothetical protein